MGAARRVKRPSLISAASFVSAAAAFGATARYIARDATPPAWDDAWYLETSFRLWTALKASPLAFAHVYLDAFHIKAPLISLIPLPLYAIFGPGERVAVWANLPLAALAAWAWSRAAAEWWREDPRGRDAAALGGALTALIPLVYGLSRVFLVETLLSCLLALFAWRCAAARRDDTSEGYRLGTLLGLGLLAKVTFPLLAAGFVWPARERLKPHAKRAVYVAVLIAATWYAENIPYVLGYAWSAGFGKIARDYAGSGWLTALPRDGFYLTLLAAAAICLAREKSNAIVLWGLSPLLVYAVGANHEVRLLAPLLPVFALMAGRAAVSFQNKTARTAAAALLLGTGLITLARNDTPSSDSGWDRQALVNAVIHAGGPDAVSAVALEHRLLNANNLSSSAAERGLPLRFVSLGYAQTSAETALIRLKDKGASTLVLVEGLPDSEMPAFLNRANAGVAAAIRSGRLPAKLSETVALAPGVRASVFRLLTSRLAGNNF
jgi:hypothetical protein